MFKIFLTNLRKYNEGQLVGEWVDLPCDDFDSVLKRIGIDGKFYEEFFISDYETNYDIKIGEHEDIYYLNNLAEELEDLTESEIIIFRAYMETEDDIDFALDHLDDAMIYFSCDDMTDVAYEVVDENGILDNVPDDLRNYFDYESYGRDLEISGTFVEIDSNIVELYY